MQKKNAFFFSFPSVSNFAPQAQSYEKSCSTFIFFRFFRFADNLVTILLRNRIVTRFFLRCQSLAIPLHQQSIQVNKWKQHKII